MHRSFHIEAGRSVGPGGNDPGGDRVSIRRWNIR